MEVLAPGERRDWKTSYDSRWVRTGCNHVWDALMWPFREYREMMPNQQKVLIRQRLGIDYQGKTPHQLAKEFMDILAEEKNDMSRTDDNKTIFYSFVPRRLQQSELVPHIFDMILSDPEITWDAVRQEIVNMSLHIATHRLEKKFNFNDDEANIETIRPFIMEFLQSVFDRIIVYPAVGYDTIAVACRNAGIHAIFLSASESVLFDSLTWNSDGKEDPYKDVVIILSHPDGRYESIGRSSLTKDGNQKISRIFSHNDDTVSTLRKTTRA